MGDLILFRSAKRLGCAAASHGGAQILFYTGIRRLTDDAVPTTGRVDDFPRRDGTGGGGMAEIEGRVAAQRPPAAAETFV